MFTPPATHWPPMADLDLIFFKCARDHPLNRTTVRVERWGPVIVLFPVSDVVPVKSLEQRAWAATYNPDTQPLSAVHRTLHSSVYNTLLSTLLFTHKSS